MPATEPLQTLLVRYGFQVLGAVVVLTIGIFAARWAGNTAQRWLQRQDMEPPVRRLLSRMVHLVVILITLVIVLDQVGLQVAPLIAGIGVAGLAIGMAVQGVFSNLLAGLSIIFTKPYRVGEYINILNEQGEVAAVDLFSTILTHPDRSRIVIPNGKIIGEILHNYGSMRQLKLSVGVGYDANLSEAFRIIHRLLAENRRVLKEPAPMVGISMLGDSAIVLSVQPWVPVTEVGPAEAEIYQAIVEQFKSGGIDIPFPQREVRMVAAG